MPKTQIKAPAQPYMRIVLLVVIVALVLLGWLWWSKVYENPRNVFWGMVSNNLATSDFTKQVKQSASGANLVQDIQMNLARSNTAHSFTTITQGNSQVETEEINTPTSDFVRYVSIDTIQKSSDGKKLNFNSILNIWGSTTAAQSPNNGQVFNQTLLGIFPIGNVSASQRANLMHIVRTKNVYSVDFTTVDHQSSNGRVQDVFAVKVQPEGYIEFVKEFAKDIGLTSLSNVNPQTYANDPPAGFIVSVDALSRNLSGIVYADSSQTETYGGYGLVQPPVALPKKTIPLQTLQTKLQDIK